MLRKLNRDFKRALRGRRIGLPGREGFTLVEILMVMLILTIGILPVAIIQHRARHEVSESDRLSQAYTVAQSHMERIKGMGFGNAAADSGTVGQIDWNCAVVNVTTGLDRIEITASWQAATGVESITIADLVSTR